MTSHKKKEGISLFVTFSVTSIKNCPTNGTAGIRIHYNTLNIKLSKSPELRYRKNLFRKENVFAT